MSKTKNEKKKSLSNSFNGKFVSLFGSTLIMTNKEGKEHTRVLAKDARFTCDEVTCKADDLKAGRRIRITTKKDDRNVVTKIESLNRNAQFATST